MNELTIAAMREALDDEYKARAIYETVLQRFGTVRSFANIVESEERHAQALLSLFDAFDIEPPEDRWRGCVTIPTTLRECCELAVAAEIENLKMYGRPVAQVDDAEVRQVLERLREASAKRHLPAFRRCSSRAESPQGARRARRRFRGGRQH